MNYREEIRQYVTEVWNYNQAVVDAFDERDYDIVAGSPSFITWKWNRRLDILQEQLLSMSVFKFIVLKIKRIFK